MIEIDYEEVSVPVPLEVVVSLRERVVETDCDSGSVLHACRAGWALLALDISLPLLALLTLPLAPPPQHTGRQSRSTPTAAARAIIATAPIAMPATPPAEMPAASLSSSLSIAPGPPGIRVVGSALVGVPGATVDSDETVVAGFVGA